MSQSFQDGFTLFIQLFALTLSRSLVEGSLQVAFHKPLAGSLYGRCTCVQDLGNLAVRLVFVGEQFATLHKSEEFESRELKIAG